MCMHASPVCMSVNRVCAVPTETKVSDLELEYQTIVNCWMGCFYLLSYHSNFPEFLFADNRIEPLAGLCRCQAVQFIKKNNE